MFYSEKCNAKKRFYNICLPVFEINKTDIMPVRGIFSTYIILKAQKLTTTCIRKYVKVLCTLDKLPKLTLKTHIFWTYVFIIGGQEGGGSEKPFLVQQNQCQKHNT